MVSGCPPSEAFTAATTKTGKGLDLDPVYLAPNVGPLGPIFRSILAESFRVSSVKVQI